MGLRWQFIKQNLYLVLSAEINKVESTRKVKSQIFITFNVVNLLSNRERTYSRE